mmetsp:Transcript_32448/g.42751  ORF Transcript_32448/g.42751 Transcript_32448/m.42751 type:complete len:98 (+) Transcript_32448:2-295(+)
MSQDCPTSQVIAFEAMKQSKTKAYNVQQALGQEFIINTALTQRSDYSEGVECAVGSKKGARPSWSPQDIKNVKEDSVFKEILNSITEGTRDIESFSR